MKIGIFDSGIGGLSVLHQAMITLPEADYIFYADVDNVPYGEKTREEVRNLVDHAVGFLVGKGCQAIVLACNTATSAAISYLREKYKLPIIGIEPAVKPAVEHIHESGRRVMVVSTPVTAKGEKLKRLIEKYDAMHVVDVVALPRLVRFAQDDDFDSSDVIAYLKCHLHHTILRIILNLFLAVHILTILRIHLQSCFLMIWRWLMVIQGYPIILRILLLRMVYLRKLIVTRRAAWNIIILTERWRVRQRWSI